MSDIGKVDPRDRTVILVASKEGLVKLVEKAYAINFVDKLAEGLFASSFFKLAKFGKDIYLKTQREELSKKSVFDLKKEFDETFQLSTSPLLVCPSDAIRQLRFGVGQTPVDGSVYVQHPIISDAYIDPADFSRTVSKEKEAAFRQLATCLGAKSLTLVNATVKTTRGLFGSTVSLPSAASEVGIKVSLNQSGEFVRKVYSEYGLPRRSPYVPPDLQPWVEMDPDLRTMARDRIDGHLLKSAITLEFKEGIGIGGEVAATLAGRGFSASGTYEAICHSIWYFEVEYYPINT